MRRIAASLLTGIVSLSIATPAFATTTINLPCMQTAVEKRENAFITAFDTYNTSVRSTMTVRRDALKSAWGISDKKQRQDAIRNAERSFSTSGKTLRKSRRDADRSVSQTFKNESRLCEIRS